MGVVYRARDRRTGALVALKTMLRTGPRTLRRFKNEFRALADITHPNVVALHELASDDGFWFFTMELLEGVDFRRYPRIGNTESVLAPVAASTAESQRSPSIGSGPGLDTPESGTFPTMPSTPRSVTSTSAASISQDILFSSSKS